MKRFATALLIAVALILFNSNFFAANLATPVWAESENGSAESNSDSSEENGASDESTEAAEDEAKETPEEKEAKPSEEEAADAKPERKTFEVAEKPIKIEENIDTVVVSTKSEEVLLLPEEWSTFKIETVTPHGTKVREGETLIKFEDKDLLDAIAELDLDLHLGEQRIYRAEQELPQKERLLRLQLANAEESFRRTEDDHRRYKETEREQLIDMNAMRLKSAKFTLDYYRDELEQLEKMYGADELTEETEEIILRRQRFYVEYAESNYTLSKYSHDLTLNVMIPRRDHDLEESLKTTKEQLERSRIASQIDGTVARYELEKQKRQREKLLDRHVKLVADKSLMSVRSPMAGIVYYGESVDGKWPRLAEMRRQLVPGKNVNKGTILMTIVDPESLQLTATIDEKLLISLKEDQKVKIQPKVEGSDELEGKIATISKAPIADGRFATTIEFSGELPEWLVPGMTAKTTAVTYEKEDALLVPQSAVHKDEMSDEEYVWLVRDDEVEKKVVKTGKKKGDQVEVTDGLSAGDVISLDKEEDKKS